MSQQQQQVTTTAMHQIIGGVPAAATPNVTVNAPHGKYTPTKANSPF
jgi:hypothetical protein